MSTTEFTVGGAKHYWTYLGQAEWDGAKVAAAITPLIEEHVRFWGSLPFKKYVLPQHRRRRRIGVEHFELGRDHDERREPMTPRRASAMRRFSATNIFTR
jgi:hypothetical protein